MDFEPSFVLLPLHQSRLHFYQRPDFTPQKPSIPQYKRLLWLYLIGSTP